jgi:hypothetical protein
MVVQGPVSGFRNYGFELKFRLCTRLLKHFSGTRNGCLAKALAFINRRVGSKFRLTSRADVIYKMCQLVIKI